MDEKLNKDSQKKSDDRVRVFTTLIYPESASPYWKDIFSDLKVPVIISPLHDQDLNPNGEAKKPHYHVMIMFEGKKSDKQVKELISSTNSVGLEHVNSIRGMARYFCHLDNPEKFQYPVSDVTCLSGADYMSIIGLPSDKYKVIGEMITYIEDNDIEYYSDMLMIAKNFHHDWFVALCDNCTMVIMEYIKSRSFRKQKEMEKDAAMKLGAFRGNCL